jgi:hypothetical protein
MKIAAIVCLLIGGLALVLPLLSRELLPDESLARVALFECMRRTGSTEREVAQFRNYLSMYLKGGSITTALPLRFTYSRMGKEIRVGKILVASDHLLYGVKVRNCKKARKRVEKGKYK